MGLDLADVLPRIVRTDGTTNSMLFDAHTLVEWAGGEGLTWTDLDAMQRTHTAVPGFLNMIATDAASGRALVLDMATKPPRMYLVRRNEAKGQPIVAGTSPWGMLVTGETVLYGTQDPNGPVAARLPDGTDKTLEALGSSMVAGAPLGHMEGVLVGSGGHVLKINAATGASERATIQPGETMVVATDRRSKIAIGVDNRLLVWEHGTVTEVASLTKRITDIRVVGDNSAIVLTDDNAVFKIELVQNASPKRLLASSVAPAIDEATTRIATFGVANDTEIIDVATGAHWTLPMMRPTQVGVTIRLVDRGALYVEVVGNALVFRRLATVEGDLGAWAHERTTAKLVDDELVWPWQ